MIKEISDLNQKQIIFGYNYAPHNEEKSFFSLRTTSSQEISRSTANNMSESINKQLNSDNNSTWDSIDVEPLTKDMKKALFFAGIHKKYLGYV